MPTLPYIVGARLVEQGGALVASEVPCAIWPGVPRVTPAGEAYDAEGQAPLDLADQLEGRNRSLITDTMGEYKIVGTQRHEFLPHVVLRLRRMKP